MTEKQRATRRRPEPALTVYKSRVGLRTPHGWHVGYPVVPRYGRSHSFIAL